MSADISVPANTCVGDILQKFLTYDFKNSEIFKDGWKQLKHTLGSNQTDEDMAYAFLKAKIYFFARTSNLSDDVRNKLLVLITDQYKSSSVENTGDKTCNADKTNVEDTDKIGANTTEPPYPKSFAEVLRCVENGEAIPGVEELNIEPTNDQVTQPQLERRTKPWEAHKDDEQLKT